MDVQAAVRGCPSALDDVSRETHRGSRVTYVCYPRPSSCPDCLALDHKAVYKKTHSRHRQLLSKEGNGSPIWVCLAVQGFKGCYTPESSMAIFTGATIRDWQNKAILWGWIHTKVCFSDPALKFPQRTQFSRLRWMLVSILQYLSFSFTKGRVWKQHHMALEKSGVVTGGKWGAWSCREDICAQRCVKFHKTQCNPQVPCGPPSCMVRNPFFFFFSWFCPYLSCFAAFTALLFSQLVCLRSGHRKQRAWSEVKQKLFQV